MKSYHKTMCWHEEHEEDSEETEGDSNWIHSDLKFVRISSVNGHVCSEKEYIYIYCIMGMHIFCGWNFMRSDHQKILNYILRFQFLRCITPIYTYKCRYFLRL